VNALKDIINSLSADGFYMPAEFSEHQATWMLWPERTDIWRLGAKPVQRVFAHIANTLSMYENVIVGVTQSQYENARNKLAERIRVIEISYDDAWARDTGPTFLANKNGNAYGVDWFFNSWGGIGNVAQSGGWNLAGSYFPWKLDDMVARKILEVEGIKRYRCPLILEGGAIHVDGEGTLIATKECINGRNPDLSLIQIEEVLSKCLGIDNFIWLNRGLYLEENNGHIDNMCCFADTSTILLNWCDDYSDPQYEISLEAFNILSKAKNSKGEFFSIVKVNQPQAMHITEEENSSVDSSEYAIPRLANSRLPASYINSYPCNGAILIPSFSSQFDERPLDYDDAALRIYQAAFKNRQIIQIPARELLLGGGGIHCILQQVPKFCKL
jgi:agmatine deiminase